MRGPDLSMTCPACGSSDLRPRRLLADLVVAICATCTLWIHEAARGMPGTEYAGVDESRFRNSIGVVRRRQAQTIVSHARRFVSGGRWLDVGVGFGYALAEARKAGFEVAGIEPDARAVAAARVLLGDVKITEGNFGAAAVAPGSVDVLSTLDVLEHVPASELAAFAALVRSALRPAGIWAIKVPTTEGLLFQIGHRLLPFARPLVARFVRRLWQCDEEYPHTVYFSRRSLTRFLQSQSFEVLATDYLSEVPVGTATDRLLVVGGTPAWLARLAAPAMAAIGVIERLRGRSDSLLMMARPIRS